MFFSVESSKSISKLALVVSMPHRLATLALALALLWHTTHAVDLTEPAPAAPPPSPSFEVTLPEGAKLGIKLTGVTSPDGQTLDVVLPAGAAPGLKLSVPYTPLPPALFTLRIGLDGGERASLPVREGDVPKESVAAFIAANKLKDDVAPTLVQAIMERVEALRRRAAPNTANQLFALSITIPINGTHGTSVQLPVFEGDIPNVVADLFSQQYKLTAAGKGEVKAAILKRAKEMQAAKAGEAATGGLTAEAQEAASPARAGAGEAAREAQADASAARDAAAASAAETARVEAEAEAEAARAAADVAAEAAAEAAADDEAAKEPEAKEEEGLFSSLFG